MLDGDDMSRAECQQRARQAAGARTDLDDDRIIERAGRARDAGGEVEVEQEILAQRFAGRQSVFADDVAQRREVVDRAHEASLAAMREASRNAAIRLAGFARPVPAMSKAVP